MSLSLQWFQKYSFDGSLYVKCRGVKPTEKVIFRLFRENVEFGKIETTGSKQVRFEHLPAAQYSLTMSASTASGFQEHKERSVVLKEFAPLQLPAAETSTFSRPDLKGSLSIPSAGNTILYVMFHPNGLEKLKAHNDLGIDLTTVLWNRVFPEAAIQKMSKTHAPLTRFEHLYRVSGIENDTVLLELAQRLEALQEVDYCSLEQDPSTLEPPPMPHQPRAKPTNAATPDFSSKQGYLDSGRGMNVRTAWARTKGAGATVRHLDFGVNDQHEDLFGNITVVTNRPETQSREHGTASTGCIAAKDNSTGVTGIAPNCGFYFYDTGGMPQAMADMEAGDIISIDLQVNGGTGGTKLFPMVSSKTWWDMIFACTDAAVVVIYAAGNGGLDLTGDADFTNFGNSLGIMIGACNSTDGRRAAFSNYNLYYTCNSWGDSVTTTGYGSLQNEDGVNRDYTDEYSGTSSATPLTSGAIALMQAYMIETHHAILPSVAVALHIQSYGYGDAAGQKIGHRPDIHRILSGIDTLFKSST